MGRTVLPPSFRSAASRAFDNNHEYALLFELGPIRVVPNRWGRSDLGDQRWIGTGRRGAQDRRIERIGKELTDGFGGATCRESAFPVGAEGSSGALSPKSMEVTFTLLPPSLPSACGALR